MIHLNSVVLISSLLTVGPIWNSCTGGRTAIEVENTDDQASVSSSTSGNENQNTTSSKASIDSFGGSATSDELSLMLNNSELSCTSGQILKFDGLNWSCANENLAAGYVKNSTGSDECSSSSKNTTRFNTSENRFEICTSLKSSSDYLWVTTKAVIQDDTTINITAGNCGELIAVVQNLANYSIHPTAKVVIQLADGTYPCSESIVISDKVFSRVEILGNETTPANVVLQFTDNDGFLINNASIGYVNGMRIEYSGTATHKRAFFVYDSSLVRVGPDMEIDGFNTLGSAAFLALNGSHVVAVAWGVGDSATITDCEIGVQADRNSNIVVPYITMTGLGTGNTDGRGVLAANSSTVNMYDATISSFYYGVEAVSGSSVLGNFSDVSTTNMGFLSHYGAFIEAASSTSTGCVFCYRTNVGGTMHANSATADCPLGGGSQAFSSYNDGYIYASPNTINGSCSNNYIEVGNGVITHP